MKMLKTLTALAFAMGLIFVAGNMSAEAYSSYKHNFSQMGDDLSGCEGSSCHASETAAGYGPEIGFETGEACSGCHTSPTTDDGNSMADADTEKEVPAYMPLEEDAHTATCGDTGTSAGCHGSKGATTDHYNSANLANTPDCNSCHVMESAPVNNAPVATDGTLTVNEDTTDNEGTVTATDADTGDTLTFTATQPANGEVVMAANGTYTYTPAANYFGTDSFEFTVTDAAGATDTGTVSITVTDVAEPVLPPADTDGDGLTDEEEEALGSDPTVDTIIIEDDDQALAIVEDGKVTGKITDMADATKYIITQGKYGTVTIAADGTWTYTVNPTATLAAAVTDTFTIQYVNTKGEVVNYTQEVEVTPASIDSIPWTPLEPSTPGEETTPPTPVDPAGEEGTEEESTNPETGGTAGLMLSLAATTVAGAGMVVFRKKN